MKKGLSLAVATVHGVVFFSQVLHKLLKILDFSAEMELRSREAKFSALVLFDLLSALLSFMISHPLYLFYLILFTPCLLKLVSFFCPLFLAMCLLSAALLTSQQSFRSPELVGKSRGFPGSSIAAAVNLSSEEEEFMGFWDLGIGEFLFGSSVMEIESADDVSGKEEGKSAQTQDCAVVLSEEVKQDKVEVVFNPVTVNPCDDSEEPERTSVDRSLNGEDEAAPENISQAGAPTRISSNKFQRSSGLNVSKEWRKTLGCQLLEERQGGGCAAADGMDSLWEVQEVEVNIPDRTKSKLSAKDDEEESGGEEVAVVCCLQGLKLSAGKMSLGVGRRKLRNITKAIKRYGWLQRHVQVNQKVHDNGDSYNH